MTPPLPTPRLTPAFAVALAGAVLLLLLQAMPGVLSTLEYRRAMLATEPWRLLTAHLVHINWTHASVNAGAWLVLARLFEPRLDAKRQLLSLLFGAAFIFGSIVLWLARNVDRDDVACRAILIAVVVSNAIGFIVTLMASLSGVWNAMGWLPVLLYLVFGLAFAYFLFMKPAAGKKSAKR